MKCKKSSKSKVLLFPDMPPERSKKYVSSNISQNVKFLTKDVLRLSVINFFRTGNCSLGTQGERYTRHYYWTVSVPNVL